jgi:hypothetical protein
MVECVGTRKVMKIVQFIDYDGRARVVPVHRIVDVRSPGANDNGDLRVVATPHHVITIAFRDGHTWQEIRDAMIQAPEPEVT